MTLKKIMLCTLIYLWSYTILSHPVTWKSGTVLTFRRLAKTSQINLHYSYTNKWSLGLHAININETKYLMVQNNLLIKRWNQDTSQANVYVFSGVGKKIQASYDTVVHIGTQIDWETRRLYTQFESHSFLSKNTSHFLSARFGVAPYLSDYNDLHSWIILQLSDTISKTKHEITIMPVVRLFIDNYLAEIGSNFSNKHMVTLMYHF